MEKWFFEENDRIAFEIDVSNDRRIMQSLVSFSNHEGGSVFFGVNPKSKIVGCYPKEIIEEMSQLVTKHCKNLEMSEPSLHEINNKRVVEYHIYKSKIPARIINTDNDNGYYIRSNSENEKAGKILSSYFHLLSKFELQNNIESTNHRSLVALINNDGPFTLAQLYKRSELNMSEIDHLLPILLFNKEVQYKLVDSSVQFY